MCTGCSEILTEPLPAAASIRGKKTDWTTMIFSIRKSFDSSPCTCSWLDVWTRTCSRESCTSFSRGKRWPLCSELPHQVNRFCRLWGIEGEFKDMPAFAPEWVFHLQLMNNSSFWSVLRYFFRFGKFPSWDLIPSLYTDWFEKLELGEFEYPSITKFEKIPEDVKKRYKILMEWRLKLTEMQFAKGKDHFAMEISSKNTEDPEDAIECS